MKQRRISRKTSLNFDLWSITNSFLLFILGTELVITSRICPNNLNKFLSKSGSLKIPFFLSKITFLSSFSHFLLINGFSKFFWPIFTLQKKICSQLIKIIDLWLSFIKSPALNFKWTIFKRMVFWSTSTFFPVLKKIKISPFYFSIHKKSKIE